MSKVTYEEVVKAWQDVEPEAHVAPSIDSRKGMRIVFPNGMYYEVGLEQVYSNRKVFSMTVDKSLHAINLTIRYLENKGEEE